MKKDKDPNDKKHKSPVDRIVMGAIIGTAIGSAMGVTLAPKKGTETRKVLKSKSTDIKELGKLGAETTSGFLKVAKRLLFGKSKKKAPHQLKKIPHEAEIIPEEYVDRD